jgi:hypothetical protein
MRSSCSCGTTGCELPSSSSALTRRWRARARSCRRLCVQRAWCSAGSWCAPVAGLCCTPCARCRGMHCVLLTNPHALASRAGVKGLPRLAVCSRLGVGRPAAACQAPWDYRRRRRRCPGKCSCGEEPQSAPRCIPARYLARRGWMLRWSVLACTTARCCRGTGKCSRGASPTTADWDMEVSTMWRRRHAWTRCLTCVSPRSSAATSKPPPWRRTASCLCGGAQHALLRTRAAHARGLTRSLLCQGDLAVWGAGPQRFQDAVGASPCAQPTAGGTGTPSGLRSVAQRSRGSGRRPLHMG